MESRGNSLFSWALETNHGVLVIVRKNWFWIICSFFILQFPVAIQMWQAYKRRGLIKDLKMVKAGEKGSFADLLMIGFR